MLLHRQLLNLLLFSASCTCYHINYCVINKALWLLSSVSNICLLQIVQFCQWLFTIFSINKINQYEVFINTSLYIQSDPCQRLGNLALEIDWKRLRSLVSRLWIISFFIVPIFFSDIKSFWVGAVGARFLTNCTNFRKIGVGKFGRKLGLRLLLGFNVTKIIYNILNKNMNQY